MDPTAHSPTDIALARLGALVAAGAPADQVTGAVGEIVAGWAAEPDMDTVTATERVGALWDSLSRDMADLQEQISDHPGGDARALVGAVRTLTAMRAAVAALAAVHRQLQG